MTGKTVLTFTIVFFFKILDAAERKDGMPQLNPDSFSSQIFWLFLFFGILLLINHFYFLPTLNNIRSKRNETIENHITKAKELNESIEKIIQDMNNNLKLAKNDYDNKIAASYEKHKLIYENEIKKITEKYDDQKVSLSNEFFKLKKKIISNIHKFALPLSDQIYEKIIGEKKNGEIEEFKKALGE